MVSKHHGYFLGLTLTESCKTTPSKRTLGNRQRGVALMAALILMLAVVMVLGNIFYRHQMDVSQAGAAAHTDQALLLALSVESWARQQVSSGLQSNGQPFNSDTVDHLGENWAQAVPMLPIEGGVIRGCIQDLQARFNINNFAIYSKKNAAAFTADASVGPLDPINTVVIWQNLLELLDFPVTPQRSAALADWLDKDADMINSWGAEQPYYGNLQPPRTVANGPMTDSSELAAVVGYSVFDVQYLTPFVSALPVRSAVSPAVIPTPININTASDVVLQALGGSRALEFFEVIQQARSDNRHFQTVAELHSELSVGLAMSLPEIQAQWPAALLDVKSSFFQLYLEVLLGDIHLQVKSTIDLRNSKRAAPAVIAREVSVVPKVMPEIVVEDEAPLQSAAEDTDENQVYRVQTACEVIGV